MKRRIRWILIGLVWSMLSAACTSADSTSENFISEENSAIPAQEPEKEIQEVTEEETEEETTEEKPEEETDSAGEDISQEAMTVEYLKEYTGPVQAYEVSKTLYATIGLNVRRGPGTDYEIIGGLDYNQAVEATGVTENGWIQCSFNGQKGYASGNYLSETRAEPKPETAANTDTAAAMEQAVPEENTNTAVPAAQGGIIMIGDSRCVQMQAAVNGGGVSWICENGKGYEWLNETAIAWADPSVGKGTKVVICLGVNDPGNVNNYAQLINARAADWSARGATVYYVSVNPVWENPYVTQEQVDNFNNTMPGLLSGVIWIDTQSWLKENGCRIVDGLHYDDPTSVNIFNLIMGSI